MYFTFEFLKVLKGVEGSGVTVSIVDAEGREELKDLFLDSCIGRIEGGGQFRHILPVLDDVIETDS